MRPVIFLDIDGVVNTSKNYHEWHKAHKESPVATGKYSILDPHATKLFDPELVGNVKEVIKRTGAMIVVSSSWRLMFGSEFELLRDLLVRVGFSPDDIAGATPYQNPERASAIQDWLLGTNQREVQMVILDDEDNALFGVFDLAPLHVQTDVNIGFKDADRAEGILRGAPWRRNR